jgi:transcriptional regulator with XRE-family HTH domain
MAQVKHDDNYYYDIVRINIRKYRKEKGLTQQKLADACDLSMDYIAEIESLKRRKSFSLATLGRIADALGVDIVKFFEKE